MRVVIARYEAELVRFSMPDGAHHALVHFPWVNGGARLTMVATCNAQDDSQALSLFRTLRFTLL